MAQEKQPRSWVRMAAYGISAGCAGLGGRDPYAVPRPGLFGGGPYSSPVSDADRTRGTAAQLAWLDELATETTDPVLVFAHHPAWNADLDYALVPADNTALRSLVGRHDNVVGYLAGHTHTNRVLHFERTGAVPFVEIACAKDYPGAWAEYQVYQGGYVQLTRRIRSSSALEWTERTRGMFAGLYRDYALGRIEDRCFVRAF
jgi:hypothetical protein